MIKALFMILALFLAACTQTEQTMQEQTIMEKDEVMMKNEAVKTTEAVMEKSASSSAITADELTAQPTLIGGTASRYYDWNKELFEASLAEGKTIFLEFHASWCPVCKRQEPALIAGFEKLNNPNVIGFKVPYKDDKTTNEHTQLARKYGIAYQHTHIVIKNGAVALKNPEEWTTERFILEMSKLG